MSVSPFEDRYKTEMNAIFEDDYRLKLWLKVEVALAHAHAKLGHISKSSAQAIEEGAKRVKLARVNEIEAEIHHDLMAMVRALTEQCKGQGQAVHLGATSYDIEDTATALQFREGMDLLRSRIAPLRKVLKFLALEKASTVCIGRTHGQHAVPTTYGMKFAIYYTELGRNLERLDEARKRISVGKMSGATGTMATFGKDGFELQQAVMDGLGLTPAPVTNQVVQRDRHAEVMFVLALVASTLDKMAKEVRNLQRTEIMEIAEPFSSKQVGSSTMPQKRNPHKAERICSLARLVRSNVIVALENIALEHERDLTNSANERAIFPGSFIATDYMLKEMHKILTGIQFFPSQIERNLNFTHGLVLSERVMIALTEHGMGRQEAHELMPTSAMEAFRDRRPLLEVLSEKKEVTRRIKKHELEILFNPHTYIGLAPQIVKKAVEG